MSGLDRRGKSQGHPTHTRLSLFVKHQLYHLNRVVMEIKKEKNKLTRRWCFSVSIWWRGSHWSSLCCVFALSCSSVMCLLSLFVHKTFLAPFMVTHIDFFFGCVSVVDDVSSLTGAMTVALCPIRSNLKCWILSQQCPRLWIQAGNYSWNVKAPVRSFCLVVKQTEMNTDASDLQKQTKSSGTHH